MCGGYPPHKNIKMIKKIITIIFITTTIGTADELKYPQIVDELLIRDRMVYEKWHGYDFLFIDRFPVVLNIDGESICYIFTKEKRFNNKSFKILSAKVIDNDKYIYSAECQNEGYDSIWRKERLNGQMVVSITLPEQKLGQAYMLERLNLIIHENFHLYQKSHFKDHPETFNDIGDDYSPEAIAIKKIENILLYRARFSIDMIESLKEFVILREYRYKKYGTIFKKYEDMVERAEGSARYIEISLDYDSPATGWMVSKRMRDEPYYIGASICYLINKFYGTKEFTKEIENGKSLFDILSEIVKVSYKEDDVKKILFKYGYDGFFNMAKRDKKLLKKYTQEQYNTIDNAKYKVIIKFRSKKDMDSGNAVSYELPVKVFNDSVYGNLKFYYFKNEVSYVKISNSPYINSKNTITIPINGEDFLKAKDKIMKNKKSIIRAKGINIKSSKPVKIDGHNVIVEI
jgi:hypothetical protein